MWDNINNILKKFNPISLEQMQEIRLMDRLDYKYVAPISQLPALLKEISPLFMVQTINDVRIAPYETQYFDTSQLDYFTMHQNGKLNRQKIRIRSYTDSNLSFLEVKNKNNKGRTKKVRIKVNSPKVNAITDLNGQQLFLNDHALFETELLKPVLENSFNRITLVNNRKTERVTIDFQVSFLNYLTNNEIELDQVMILELKQDGFQYSDFRKALELLHIRQVSFSKYCIGVVLTDPNAKYNQLKKKLRRINKLTTNDTIDLS